MIDNITIRIENFTGKFDNCVKSKKEKIALMKLALMKITLFLTIQISLPTIYIQNCRNHSKEKSPMFSEKLVNIGLHRIFKN